MEMLKQLYRSFVIARAADASDKIIHRLSDQQLLDVGINRYTHRQKVIARLKAEFAAKDVFLSFKTNSELPVSYKRKTEEVAGVEIWAETETEYKNRLTATKLRAVKWSEIFSPKAVKTTTLPSNELAFTKQEAA
jgi:hypothetical protein